MTNEKSLDELVQEARLGDMNSERILLEKLRVRFINLVKYKIWNYHADKEVREQEAQDLVQEALITFSQKYLNTDAELHNILALMNMIVRKKIGNYIHAFQRKILRETHFAEDEEGCVVEPIDLNHQEKEDSIILVLDIKRALTSLCQACRKIFQILLQGGSREEIFAQFPDLTPNAVDVRIHRCREELKARLRKGWYNL